MGKINKILTLQEQIDGLRIAYLNSDDSSELDFSNSEERDKQILKHDEVEYYTLDEFICAFNNEEISDLGYAVIVHH